MTVLALVIVLGVLLALTVVVLPWLLRIAQRLDRLHIRVDAAGSGLLASLDRRAVVARSIDVLLRTSVHGEEDTLSMVAAIAESSEPDDRESAENLLTRRLALIDREQLPAALNAELGDAEFRLVLARRVYNDAVRDALALRARRIPRWLRLAGTAPLPQYFEVAEPELDATPGWRRSARVIVLTSDGRVLLLRCKDPARPQHTFWITPGGGVEAAEDLPGAAVRELAEETGLSTTRDALVG
ncbi:MAG: NUDIX domain-containing protein, partial [Sciscionella sp.]